MNNIQIKKNTLNQDKKLDLSPLQPMLGQNQDGMIGLFANAGFQKQYSLAKNQKKHEDQMSIVSQGAISHQIKKLMKIEFNNIEPKGSNDYE